MHWLPKVPPLRALPPALAAVATSVAFEWALVRAAAGYRTNLLSDYADISAGLPQLIWRDPARRVPPLDGATLAAVLPAAGAMAAVGIVESLMTLRLVDEITGTKGRPHLETAVLGVANALAGALGGQGGCSEIGLTILNVRARARHRLSSTAAALLVFIFTTAAGPYIGAHLTQGGRAASAGYMPGACSRAT